MLTIIVNGEQRAAKPGATVSDLLHEMSLDPGRVAIERNLEILSRDRKSTRLNSSHGYISYAVFCLKKKKQLNTLTLTQGMPPRARPQRQLRRSISATRLQHRRPAPADADESITATPSYRAPRSWSA